MSLLSCLTPYVTGDNRQEGSKLQGSDYQVTDTHQIPERRWVPRQSRQTSPLQPLSPCLAAAGTTPSLASGLLCPLNPRGCPGNALGLRALLGEEGVEGWGEQRWAVSGSRGGTLQPISRSRGPPGRPGWCCLGAGGVLAARESVHLLPPGGRTRLEAAGCEHRGEDLVVASPRPCSLSLQIFEPQGLETRWNP